jgi:hypothetical protein
LHATANYRGQYSGNPAFDDQRQGRGRGRGDVHARFETGYVRANLDALKAEVTGAMRTPRILQPGEITPLAISASRDAYRQAASLLSGDNEAARRADPQRAWARYVAAARPVFGPIAARQLAAASNMLADFLLTASRGTRLVQTGDFK